jgi:arylsulfatase A-like enzyme
MRSMRRSLFSLLFLALACCAAAAAPPPNIVLVTLEATRADRMGFLGSRAGLTPALDRLAREGLVFESAYAQAPQTVPSHASLLTGTYPQFHRVTGAGIPLATSVPYLPDLLRARGYRTAAFVGSITLDPQSGFAPGFDRGLDVYDAGFRFPQPTQGRYQTVERRAGDVVARALRWLQRGPRPPFFLWLQLNDPHAPYEPPAPIAARHRSSRYDGEVASADAALAKVVAALRQHKLYDDAIILVAADHGESLGAHGEDTHGIFLYDETLRVPLLLKLPKNQMAGKRVAGRVRLVDVAPTVLEAAGLPVPPAMQGQSLLRMARGPATDQPASALSDSPRLDFGWAALESWRAGKYLLVRAPTPELYDLSADPGATRNLAQSSKAVFDTLASQLEGFDRRVQGGAAQEARLSSSELQKLASLGYVGLQRAPTSGFRTVGGINPTDQIAAANTVQKALAEVEDAHPEKAAGLLQPLLAAQPKLHLAQFVLGVARIQQKQYPQAVEALRKAIELMPDSVAAHSQMAIALAGTGDWKTAAIHLEIVVARLPRSADAHSRLADAYAHLGRAADAERERRAAQALSRKP